MPSKMTRGKNQIMYGYLPGYTFDFDKSSAIAQIESIRGIQRTDLNLDLILQAVQVQAAAWRNLAPIFTNNVNPEQFVLLEPKKAYSVLFPKVFWCQNSGCGRVFDYSQNDNIPWKNTCSVCKRGKLIQLRWVRVHRCGDIQPLAPPWKCKKCNSQNTFALDTRNSERISQFVWICRQCGNRSSLFGGNCRSCNWSEMVGDGDPRKRQMNIEVHRANRVFYPHYAVLLNQPGATVNSFLALDKWEIVAGSFFVELPELEGQTIETFAVNRSTDRSTSSMATQSDFDQLLSQGRSAEEVKLLQDMLSQLQGNQQQQDDELSPKSISKLLSNATGVQENVWKDSGREMLESVMPFQSDQTVDIFELSSPNNEQIIARQQTTDFGLSKLSLASDFPMTHVTFGYSRVDYAPGECRLNPFPPDRDQQGKFPLFVDSIQADAILIRLEHERVFRWLERNNVNVDIPATATNKEMAKRAYFVQMFSELNTLPEPALLTQTLQADNIQARMVFGLLHTMSHLFLKKAALLCGLDRTSMAEYILPSSLTFAIYCNHRHGATIGALSSLFEQSLPEWLGQIRANTQRCIYDPVCQTKGGNCHACTHLAETSCQYFNVNLGRPFLFGGYDAELGNIDYGYWDASL